MEKDRIDYRNIRTLQELQYHRRLLSSRIDHQEIMVMYKLRCVWEFISPSNLFSMGCRAIASYNPSFGFIYRTVEGSHLAKMLSMEYHEITVISPDEESLERISGESDIITVEGNSSSIETLIKAGVRNADLFIAVNPDSEQDINIVSSILAKKLGAKKVTARINNEEYQKNENRILFTDLGIDSLFYPEKIAATEIVNLLKQNTASEFMNYSHGKLQLIVYKLVECSPMVDRTVAELRERTQNLFRSVAISRDNKTIIPKSATRKEWSRPCHFPASPRYPCGI